MEGGIFLLADSGGLIRMTEQPYEAEAMLQTLLADYPELLAGDQVNTQIPRRWLLIQREAGVPSQLGGADRWSLTISSSIKTPSQRS